MEASRRGEIANKMLLEIAREELPELLQPLKKELAEMAKILGMTYEEIAEFAVEVSRELVEDTFAELRRPPAVERSTETSRAGCGRT